MKVMLLSAGLGSRLLPYTHEKPKPAIPFLTAPLAGFSLSLIEKIKVDRIVVNTHHLPKEIENLFRWIKLPTKKIGFTFEEVLLGSGGGILNAASHLEGKSPFLVMNADEIILPHQMGMIEDFVAFHKSHKGIASLLTMNHPEVGIKFGGAWTLENSNQINLFSKTQPGSGYQGHHFVGVMILEPKIFGYFKSEMVEENILYETLTKAMAAGEEAYVYDIGCEWFEIGNEKDFLIGVERCLEALDRIPNEPLVEHLAQTLRVYGEGKTIIEKTDLRLLEKMRLIFKKNFIRLDD